MALGTKVGLRPGHIVLHMRTQLPLPKGAQSPFSAHVSTTEHLYKRSPENGSPYATGPLSCLSCLSVTLVYCGKRLDGSR